MTNDLGPRAGGIESFILGLLGELDGSQIVIYTSAQSGDGQFDLSLEKKFGVKVIRDKSRILLPTPRVNRAIADVMKKHGSEIIWYGATAPLGWMAGHLKRQGARRQVGLTHGHEVWWSKVWPFSWVMKRICRNLDVITFLGKFTHHAMEPILGDKVHAVRIAPGIAIDHFTPGVPSEALLQSLGLREKKIIVSVGRLVHRKGQDRLIEALPQIIQEVPDVALLLVGEGPYKAHLEKLVTQLNLHDYVYFVGRVQYRELPDYLRLGAIFAMPSRSRFFGLEVEGLGIVYLEASSTGIPVLGGASGGAPDAVLDGVTGLVVDGDDVAAISAAAISLLLDPKRREQMAIAGREWAMSNWSWTMWGERFNALLWRN